ncbi:MAG: ThuA domain-containing protein [Planctomycetes bacterium]|nr:ThuA domain-containing protein [Planctomycetota bacterium]
MIRGSTICFSTCCVSTAQATNSDSACVTCLSIRKVSNVISARSFGWVCGCVVALGCSVLGTAAQAADEPWIVFEGGDGPGKGKHVVLVSGDDEYRSEEALPQLAKILSKHHGFKCTVLFAIDKTSGEIRPDYQENIPGLEALKTADLMVMFLRFRNLPDDQMAFIDEYANSGKPIVAIRTSTHAFNLKDSKYQKYTWTSGDKGWEGGFGRQVFGETWISHHGNHGSQSTRGLIAPGVKDHPILRGIKDGDVWGPTDVYGVRLPLPGDSCPLILGQVVAGMKFDDKPVDDAKKQNDPMMPVAWTKSYTGTSGKASRIFTTTMGSSQDLTNEGFRRLLVNACYWGLGWDDKIPAKTAVDIVGDYKPTPFGFGTYVKGKKPADYAK